MFACFSTGIAVNREATAKETIISSCSMKVLDSLCAKSVELVTEKPLLFCKGAKISARYLDVLYSVVFLNVTI